MPYVRLAFLVAVLPFLSPGIATATVWYVDAFGTGDAPTIQAALDSAAVGDTVLVGPGTYPGPLVWQADNVLLRSETGRETTTLDGSGLAGPLVTFDERTGTLEGITLTGADHHAVRAYRATVHLTDCRATENGVPGGDAVLYGEYVGWRIRSPTRFWRTTSPPRGGAVYFDIVPGTIGAICVFERNLFVGNRATAGSGGAINSVWDIDVTACTFDGNECTDPEGGGTIHAPRLFGFHPVASILTNSVGAAIVTTFYQPPANTVCLWNNVPPTTAAAMGDQILADPLYCDPGSEDYCLAVDSPALGMGFCPDPGCGSVPVRSTTWGALKRGFSAAEGTHPGPE